ncbi:MAG: DUF4331 family protein [Planctomycetota bacterium]
MKIKIHFALLTLFTLAGTAMAADHLDAPDVAEDGRLDINDIYMFQSPTNSANVVMVMTVNPIAGVMSPTTFASCGRYQFHIDNNGDASPDITYELTFGRPQGSSGSQRVVLRRNRALIARGLTGRNVSIRRAGGGLLRCGTFDDPFFFDLGGFQNGLAFTGEDFFEGLNVSAIVLEVPRASLGGDNVSLWCRTLVGQTPFDRMGRPAINTVLISSENKNAFNLAVPAEDPSLFGDEVQAAITGLSGDADLAATLTGILLPDVLTVDTSSNAGFLNGRQLADDVIDAELGLLTAGAVTGDGVDANDVAFPGTFPYLAPAH